MVEYRSLDSIMSTIWLNVGVGIYFVDRCCIAQDGVAIATGGREDDGQLDDQTPQLAPFHAPEVRGEEVGNRVAFFRWLDAVLSRG